MRRLSSFKTTASGFTLVELLLVIAIIGILAVTLTGYVGNSRRKARDAKRKSDITKVAGSLTQFYNDYNKFPDGPGFGNLASAPPTGLVSTYLDVLPSDPKTGNPNYTYIRESTPGGGGDQGFALVAALENADDPQRASGTGSGGSGAALYRLCGGTRSTASDCSPQ